MYAFCLLQTDFLLDRDIQESALNMREGNQCILLSPNLFCSHKNKS